MALGQILLPPLQQAVNLTENSIAESCMPIPVILDTDIGLDVDDVWALAHLLNCPELDIKLITTCTGDTTYRAALVAKMLEVAGRTDISIGVGLAGKGSLKTHSE